MNLMLENSDLPRQIKMLNANSSEEIETDSVNQFSFDIWQNSSAWLVFDRPLATNVCVHVIYLQLT